MPFVLNIAERFHPHAHLPRDTGQALEVVSNLFCCTDEVSHGDDKDRQMDSRLNEEHSVATLVIFESKKVHIYLGTRDNSALH